MQPPAGNHSSTAPGVIGAGHDAYEGTTVSQLFSLARSPREPGPMAGFWLGRPATRGALSASGGYEPVVPAAAAPLGANGDASCALSVIDSLPSEHPLPLTFGQGFRLLLRTLPDTGKLAASPNGPAQPLPGGAA